MLLNAIRQIQPDYREPPIMRSPGAGYNRNDLSYFRCYFNSIRTNPCNANGQIHHLFSKAIMNALQRHPTLSGLFNRENPLFKYPAANRDAHKGYQEWHRNVDNEVVQWLRSREDATIQEFTGLMMKIYQRPEISGRVPNVYLGGCQ